MAEDNSRLQSSEIPDQVVEQVGKAVAEILKLRDALEENMTKAQTEDERQTLATNMESAAVRVIGDQGLTVARYNQVIASAQADEDLEQRVVAACRAA
jgi:hypothetical protein